MDEKILDKSIESEYSRYEFVKQLSHLDSYPDYGTCLEMFLMDMANLEYDSRTDQVFVNVEKSHPVYDNLRFLQTFNPIYFYVVDDLIDQIHLMINDYLNGKYHIPFDKSYQFSINEERKTALKKALRCSYPEYEKFFDKLLLICYLRYQSILPIIKQQALPKSFYSYVYKNLNIKLECFASPFNAQLLLFDEKCKFCSLFYDTDKYFGSIGNFFKVDINTSCVIFPPQIHKFIDRTIDKINKIKSPILFITTPILDIYPYAKKFIDLKFDSKRILRKYMFCFEDTLINPSYDVQIIRGKELGIYSFGKFHKETLRGIYQTMGFRELSNSDAQSYEKILSIEYDRWTMVKKIHSLRTGYEWTNILERFLNTMANIENKKRSDPVLIDVPLSTYVYNKFISEMKEKHILDGHDIASKINSMINHFVNKKNHPVINYGHYDNMFFLNEYQRNLQTNRIYAMRKKLGEYNKYSTQLILITIMRYESILEGGQHWNLPNKWYAHINRTYDVKLECFASPFNSQLMLIDPSAIFCSLFSDTDSYFGSVGSLFEFDMKSYSKSMGGYVNLTLYPPNIEHLIVKMIELIDHWFTFVPKLRVFTGLLEWTDFEPINQLDKHKFLKHRKVLKLGEYYFENSLDPQVPKLYTAGTNPYISYILANFDLDPHTMPYEESIKFMHP